MIRGWNDTFVDITIQQMLHFGLANNLLASVGGAPRAQRPNLPTSPPMYRVSFRLALRPFDERTLVGSVFLERP